MHPPIEILLFKGAGVDRVNLTTGNSYGHELSQREVDVLHLKMDGLTNKEVAHKLEISEQTVKNYVTNMLVKTGAPSALALCVRWAKAMHGPDCPYPPNPEGRVAALEARVTSIEALLHQLTMESYDLLD